MKSKIYILLLLLLSTTLTSVTYADDALPLPQHLFRFTINTAYSNFDTQFGQSSKESLGQELTDFFTATTPTAEATPETTIFRQDFITEYGVTDRVSTQIQIPFYSFAESVINSNDDMRNIIATLNATGEGTVGKAGYMFTQKIKNGEAKALLGDITVGVKYQLFNTAGTPLDQRPGTFRGAVAVGLSIPTGSVVTDPLSNDLGTTKSGVAEVNYGLRTYWDYQIRKDIYVNLYTEHEYRPVGSYQMLDIHQGATTTYDIVAMEFDPGEYHKVELDFAIYPQLNKKWRSASGFKIIGEFNTEGEYSRYPSTYGDEANDATTKQSSELYSFQPYLGLFLKDGPFPLEAKLKYTYPIMGRNAASAQVIELQCRAYLKFW